MTTKPRVVGSMSATSGTPVVAVVSDWARCGVRVSSAAWGCGAAGSAPRSQRGGQGFESPQLHRHNRRSKALSRSGTRASAVSEGEVQQQSTAVAHCAVLTCAIARWNLSDQGCSRLTRRWFVKEYLFLSNISWTLVV